MALPQDWNERVWNCVACIPSGKVTTYGAIAEACGFPRGARHVSRALSGAPKGLDLPWFRVINASGGISFETESEDWYIQKSLLEGEGISFSTSHKIKLPHYFWSPK